MTAITTGERFGGSRQGKRDSIFGSNCVVEGNGLAKCYQQATPRKPQKRTICLATTVKKAKPPRNNSPVATWFLFREKHDTCQTRDDAAVCLTREQLPTSHHQHNLPRRRGTIVPTAAVPGGARQPEMTRRRSEALRDLQQDSKQSDAET